MWETISLAAVWLFSALIGGAVGAHIVLSRCHHVWVHESHLFLQEEQTYLVTEVCDKCHAHRSYKQYP